MVFPAEGEQHIDFRVHNTTWEPVDYDGIKLMLHPSVDYLKQKEKSSLPKIASNAERFQMLKNKHSGSVKQALSEFVVVDIETTGLDRTKDQIIEIASILVVDGNVKQEFSKLIKIEKELPSDIIKLTGISDNLLNIEGVNEKQAISELIEFIGDRTVICHNASFDINFIQSRCRKLDIPMIRNKVIDTLALARKINCGASDYKLETLAKFFTLNTKGIHRALVDCYLTFGIFLKLNEKKK